jgi:Carbohydrate-selective porin, OprB family
MSISNFGATHPYNSLSKDISVWSRLEKQPSILLMYGLQLGLRFLLVCGLCSFAFPAHSQTVPEEPIPGPDSHETGQGPHGHLFGDWGGERTRLEERGVSFDFQYISDSLWNLKSVQKERLASWNRFRWTVDIDFGKLTGQHDLYFHATALWQGGGNLGTYLGLLTGPSGMASMNTCRLDSWWIEKRWLDERITARVGQFAGQDFYGAQHYAASFIFEPMGYALGNLFTTYEIFDPPSTPAMEIRAVPIHNLYVKLSFGLSRSATTLVFTESWMLSARAVGARVNATKIDTTAEERRRADKRMMEPRCRMSERIARPYAFVVRNV